MKRGIPNVIFTVNQNVRRLSRMSGDLRSYSKYTVESEQLPEYSQVVVQLTDIIELIPYPHCQLGQI